MDEIAGRIVTPTGVIAGRLRFSAQIQTIEPDPSVTAQDLILPGFIDLHVHGGGGGDVMEGAEAVRRMARFHARHGTTSLLATTVTAPKDTLRTAFAGIAEALAEPAEDAAEIIGVHLEGPFIHPEALGAQPPFAIPPDLALIAELHATAPIRVATFAPEIDEDGRLLKWLGASGIRAQIGHSRASYEEAKSALDAGAAGFTHLFNAMTGLHHRAPGAAGCAMAHALWAELILDFQHVAPGAALAALRTIPNVYAITDAVAAAGMPDGPYRLGENRIIKQGLSVRLENGALAGSILTMERAFANFESLGLDPSQRARRCATLPADYLGLEDRGRIAQGRRADLVILDEAGGVRQVWREGRPISP